MTLPVLGSIRVTFSPGTLAAHTEPPPTASAPGLPPTGTRSTSGRAVQVEAGHRAGVRISDPERAVAGSHRCWSTVEGDRLRRRPGIELQPDDLARLERHGSARPSARSQHDSERDGGRSDRSCCGRDEQAPRRPRSAARSRHARRARRNAGSCSRIFRCSSRSSGPGSSPKLLRQPPSTSLVRGEGLGLPAGGVQRDHQLAEQPLPERLLADERFQLRDKLGGAADLQVGRDPVLESEQSTFLQPSRLELRERLVQEVGQGRPAPERERLVQRFGRGGRISAPCPLDERAETIDVELAVLDAHEVAGRTPNDPVRAEQAAQA